MQLVKPKSLIYILLLFLYNSSAAQDFKITHYSTKDKLPANLYFDAIQTGTGKLLFASEFGLMQYESGTFSSVSGVQRISHPIVKLINDEYGRIWALPQSPLESIKIIQKDSLLSLKPLTRSDSTFFVFKTLALFSRDDNLYPVVLDNKHNLSYLNNSYWQSINKPNRKLRIRDLYSDGGNAYAVTNQGIFLIKEGKLVYQDNINKILPSADILKVYSEEYGSGEKRLWILSKNWLGYIERGTLTKLISDFSIIQYRDNSGYYCLAAKDNKVIFGSQNSLFYYITETSSLFNLTTPDQAKIKGATSVLCDYENNFWITSYRGLYRVRQTPFRNFDSNNKLSYDEVTAIEPLSKNTIALGQEGNLALFNRVTEIVTNIPISSGEEDNPTFARIWDLHTDNYNRLWIADYANGVGILKGTKIRWLPSTSDKGITSITQDTDNKFWACSYSSIYSIKNEKIEISEISGSFSPRKIFTRTKGGIFIATLQSGLYVYLNNELRNYRSSNSDGNNVYAVCETEKFGVLAGTKDGLYKVEGDSLKKVRDMNLRIDIPIYFILNGERSDIWFGTNMGTFKYSSNILKHFTLSDGLSGLECNRDAAYMDTTGKIWIGTDEGLSIYNKEFDDYKLINPRGKIDYISTNSDKMYSPGENIEVPYGQRNILIKLSAYTYIDNDFIFRIKLKLNNNEIVDSFATSKTELRYPSLSPGHYKFFMRVENGQGLLSDSTYTAAFSITQPFYLQPWLYILVVVFTAAITSIVFKYSSQIKQSRKLEELVKLRTKELQDEIHEKSLYENALINSELRYKNLFNNSAFGIYQSTLEGKIVLCNKAFRDMIGAKHLDDLKNLDIESEFYTDSRQDFINLIRKNEAVVGIEKEYRTLDNRIIWVRESARLIRNNKNQILIEGAIEDITANKRAEKEILRAKEKAESSDRLKSEFLAQMSHEIRTPVNTILSFSSLIKEQCSNENKSDVEDYFSAITHGSKRLIRTIDSILNLSQLQLGNYEAKFEKIDIIETIRDILDEFKYAASAKGIKLNLISKENSLFLTADLYSVSQLIANLVDNAIKYTEKGSISINALPGQDTTTVTVEDTGVGMSEEFLKEIFVPFSQEETGYSRRYEGTGLGLSLVKRYCELNNADISVESKKGVGSKFTITFKLS